MDWHSGGAGAMPAIIFRKCYIFTQNLTVSFRQPTFDGDDDGRCGLRVPEINQLRHHDGSLLTPSRHTDQLHQHCLTTHHSLPQRPHCSRHSDVTHAGPPGPRRTEHRTVTSSAGSGSSARQSIAFTEYHWAFTEYHWAFTEYLQVWCEDSLPTEVRRT